METTNLAPGGQEYSAEEHTEKPGRFFAFGIAVILIFAFFFNGAHDLWASTVVYLSVLILGLALIWRSVLKGLPLHVPLWPLLLMASMVFSVCFAGASNPSVSFLWLMDWSCGFVVFFIAANVLGPQSRRGFIEKAVFVGLAMAVVRSGMQPENLLELSRSPILINNNFQAAFLLFWFPIALERWRGASERRYGWLWGGALGVCIILLTASQSMWAWVCVFVFLVCRKNSLGRWGRLLALALAVVGLIVAQRAQPSSPADRFMWWSAALQMFYTHVLTGIGPGNFASAYLIFKPAAGLNTLYAHSLWLGFLAETGLLGFLAFVTLLAAWGARVRRNIIVDPSLRPYVCGVALFLAFASVNLGPEILLNVLVLLLFMGICVSAETARHQPRLSIVILLTALAVGATPFLVSPFFASRYVVDGQLALAENDTAAAKRSFNNAVELDARAWEPYAGLAAVAFRNGDAAGAVRWQQQALQRNRLSVPLERELERYRRLPG